MLPWAQPCPHPKRLIGSAVFCAHGRGQRVPILHNGPLLFSLKITHLHGDLDLPGLPSNTRFLAKPWVHPKSRIHDRDRQTHRQTDHERYHSVCNNRQHRPTGMEYPKRSNIYLYFTHRSTTYVGAVCCYRRSIA